MAQRHLERLGAIERFMGTRQARQEAAAAGEVEFGDIKPMVEIFREGFHRAAILCIDRDAALEALCTAPSGYGVDEMICAIDAVGTFSPTNPITGEAWQPGEMESDGRMYEQLTGTKVVYDEITLLYMNRDDRKMETCHMRYDVTGPTTLAWHQPFFVSEYDGDGKRADGFFIEAFNAGFDYPDFLEFAVDAEQAVGAAFGFDIPTGPGSHDRRLMADCVVTLQFIFGQRHIPMIHPKDEAELQAISEFMADFGVEGGSL